MSNPLESIDLLVDVSKVLYNERIVEQRKQIKDLKNKQTFIYYTRHVVHYRAPFVDDNIYQFPTGHQNDGYYLSGFFNANDENHTDIFKKHVSKSFSIYQINRIGIKFNKFDNIFFYYDVKIYYGNNNIEHYQYKYAKSDMIKID